MLGMQFNKSMKITIQIIASVNMLYTQHVADT